jgi:5'-phosphate synthase pdxT subunit
MKELNIGVLGLQGAIEEHIAATSLALNEMGLEGKVLGVKTPKEVQTIDGLIMPGGESTVIGGLSILNQAFAEVKQRISGGMPVLGTCAGMILLAKRAFDRVAGETEQPIFSSS